MTNTQDLLEEERRAAVRQALGALSGLVPFGVIAADTEGRPWYLSQRWQDLSLAQGRDRPWYTAVHPDDRDDVAERWRAAVGRRGRLGEFRVIGPDGGVRSCGAETVTMVEAGGETAGHLVVITDAATGDPHEASPETPAKPGAPAPAAEGWASLSTSHLLDVVLDRSQDVITILNADGSWRWSNGGAIRLVGHQADFDPASGLISLVHPDDKDGARALLSAAVSDKLRAEVPIEVRIRDADKSWRWMEGFLVPLLDEPSVRGFVVHLHDITERRRNLDALEAANRRLVDLVERLHTAVVLEDEDGRVVHANQAFVELFRLSSPPDSLVGKSLPAGGMSVGRLVAEPRDAEERVRVLRARAARREGFRVVLYDGRTLDCDFVPILVQGVYRGYLSTYRDVSAQARAEAERERLLDSEREENRRLAELDAYRSESLAAVSHELRTPLTSIVGYTQLLRSTFDASTPPETVAYLDAIARNVDRLLRLAGDVVALDSLESRTMPLPTSAVDVPLVVDRAVRTVMPEVVERSIHLEVESQSGPEVQGDEDRLAQLLENLLSNAVKFTLPKGRIAVRAVPIARDTAPGGEEPPGSAAGLAPGPSWEVSISDSGIGIPDDELAMLSTRFFRASNARQRGLPGSGLGLSVARAIAERHGGGLEVRSAVGVGTTVTVRVGDVVNADTSETVPEGSGTTDG